MADGIFADLFEKLREQVKAEMADVQITDFRAKSDLDHDGDPILRLQIAYDEAGAAPRPEQVSALARHLRPWLDSRLPDTFPVFRFLTTRELADETK